MAPTPDTAPLPRGFLVVLEGIDGTGKTTLANALESMLVSRGHRVVQTREPTQGPYGLRIRQIAANGREHVSAEEEFQLFHADRKEHVERVVRPALESGAIVIQDRSFYSTVAYQGERGLDRARLLAESRAIAPDADLLFVVDLAPEAALRRIRASRGMGGDDFERAEALHRVRASFLSLPNKIVLDGSKLPGDVALEALERLLDALARV